MFDWKICKKAELEALAKAKAELEQQLKQERIRLTQRNGALDEAERLNEALQKLVEKEAAKRNVAWPKPATRMKDKEVVAALTVAMDDPQWRAVHQLLDDYVGDVLDELTQDPSATLTSERRLHLAGGAEYLRRFQKLLLDVQQRGNNEETTEV